MPVPPLDDRALEALLSGARSSQSGFDWLVPFVEELGEASSGPAPAAQPALAMLLAEGFPTGAGAVGAPARPGRQANGATRRLLGGVAGKVAGLGLAAKVAMGLSLTAVSTTAAGAVGVLPDPAQHAVATVVAATTPFNFPDAANDNDNDDDKARFGVTVSTDATGASDGAPGVEGPEVSDAAKTQRDPESRTAADPRADETGSGGKAPAVGPSSGATGLDRANETPASGRAPTSVPSSKTSTGLERANETPAADRAPLGAPPAGRPGVDAQGSPAGDTPGAGRAPAGRPGRP